MCNFIARVVASISVLAFLGVAGCGGSGGSGSMMSLSVGDAPVDGAEKVVVVFSGVQLIPDAGDPVTINFAAPRT
ncbi:MAG TPA: hypothetical protein VM713_04025, partial [Steroidobacteraceae bacterium]|nr:hypothetical protein [Steroidobacteraceae bacterium]